MLDKLKRFPFNTIKFKLLAGIIAFMLPVQILLLYSSSYAIRVTQNQVAASYRDMLSLYMGQIDGRLEEVGNYLYKLVGLDEDVQSMINVVDESDYMSAKVRVYLELSRDVLIYDIINSIFIFSETHDDFVQVFDSTIEIDERLIVNSFVRSIALDGYNANFVNSRIWHTQKIQDHYYLFKIMRTNDLYIGAWTKVENLKLDLSHITIGEKGASFFINEYAEPMSHYAFVNDSGINLTNDYYEHFFSGNDNEYLVIGESSEQGKFSMVAVILIDTILERLPHIQLVIFWLSIAFVLLIPLYFLLLRKTIFVPLETMLKAMNRINKGDMSSRIEAFPVTEEFRIVNETFNDMMFQIQELKINVYEEKINKQQTELKYLQMQVNPHFFLNSLNIIYSLARTKKYDLIQEMALCLINYFRYMLKSDSIIVPLAEELKHVNNYIRIQQMRFPECVKFSLSVPEFLLDRAIPSLMILIFVENSIKYGVADDNTISIEIAVDIEKRDDLLYLKVSIKDSGNGFDECTLSKLHRGEMIRDDRGDHIGIWNIRKRLKMLYGDNACIDLYNLNTGGAAVEIFIPTE